MKLEASNVEVMYLGAIMVLRGISLEVNEGQIVALLGANGAGKTTTLKAISGLLKTEEGRITAGTITYDGHHIENLSPDVVSKLGILQVQEGRRIFEHLSVEQNLMAGAHARTDRAAVTRDLDMVYEMFPKLELLKNSTSGYVSGGERQMLVMGRALMGKPKMLLLDEPSLGLAPLLVREIFETIKRIREEGTPILLVEQNARIALNVADYGYVMENGRIVLDDPADKLKTNQDVQEFYLGLSELGQKKSFKDIKHYKRRKRWL